MQNRKKLYRSLAAAVLMLLAGLVLAPTVVTAGFHPANKKLAAASAQPTVEIALKPVLHSAQRREHDARPAPTTTAPASPTDTKSVPQPDSQPVGTGQDDFDDTTTFALNDFVPTPSGRAVFLQGPAGAAFTVAATDTGASIVKLTRKPKPPVAGNSTPENTGDTTPAGDKPAEPPTTPQTQNGGDAQGQPGTPDNHDSKPTDGQYADNDHGTRPTASVPEPSSIVLLAAGLIGLAIARRRS